MKKSLHVIFLSFLYFSPHFLFSQRNNKINFPLRTVIAEKHHEQIHFAVKGDSEKVKQAVKFYGGNYKYSFKDYSFVSVPAKNVEEFSKNDFVERIEFSRNKGVPLNDTMKINMNVIPVHEGMQPLFQSYDGTDVLIGVIDLGIELNHPDFKDSLGKTRILSLWDQTMPFNSARTPFYGYGQVWDSTDINSNVSGLPVEQQDGHGSHVAGVAAGNGNALPDKKYKGMAPNANLIVVSSDLDADDWLQTIADAVDFIFSKADAIGKSCVINISMGTYSGSHDGKDLVAQSINEKIIEKNGRAVVCAAGNAGNAPPFHLRTNVNSDTSFTWFKVNNCNSICNTNGCLNILNYSSVYFQLWADTADFNNVQFAVGADRADSVFSFRGRTPFDNIQNRLNILVTDTIFNGNGQKIAIVDTWAEEQNGNYLLEVHLKEPDSIQYNFRFMTTGSGMFDVWSTSNCFLGTSEMVYDSLPSVSDFPDIVNYVSPDTEQTIVSSFTCAPNVITVGNYTNRASYMSYYGEIFTDTSETILPGMRYPSSSTGPTRDGRIKPDITAPGAPVISAGKISILQILATNGNTQLSVDTLYFQKGGTSHASPAVAGLAALYFQKCPNAGFNDLYNDLTQNARTDTSTGIVPNNLWGYGKADAFATLNATNFSASLNHPDSIACPNGAKLSVNGNYNSYTWNNGATGSSTEVNITGNYFATVSDSKGCKARTDTVNVIIDSSLPSPSIFPVGDTEFCEGDSVQLLYPDTFITYIWSNGNATNGIFTGQTGFYNVTAIASNGCKFSGEPVLVSVFVNPPIPGIFQNADTLISTPANNYQWYLNGNALLNDTAQTLIISEPGFYSVQTFHINGCSSFSDSVYVVKTGEEFAVHGSGFRIFPNPNEGKFIVELPSSDPIAIGFRLPSVITIYNLLGEKIYEQQFSVNKNPIFAEIDLSEHASGIYFAFFQMGSLCEKAKIFLTK